MDEKMVSLRINDIPVTVPEGSTVLEAARSAGFNIPSLCFLKDINEIGACRICVVEVKGAKSLVASCVYPVAEGMEVYTNTERVRKSRQLTLELILSNHRMDCLTCSRNSHCELLQLAGDLGIDAVRYANDNMPPQIEASAPHLVRDNSKCVLCRRCTAVCRKTQEVGVIGPNDRGFHTHIGCAFDRDLAEVDCVSCGQCIVACPTGALSEKDDTARVLAALNDPAKHVVVGPAPSIRVTLGECFGLPIGTNVEGKMVTALRRLGFDKVFDVDTAADFTILEEGTEFLSRLNGGGTLPLITSCSPGWVTYLEKHHPELIDHLSTAKSPQAMFGAVAKTYYAQKMGWDPHDVVSVSVMPCTAKKYEASRPELGRDGYQDVDYVLTTRELAKLIRYVGLDLSVLPESEFDSPLGTGSGAGAIFGATGGVMEAALRTAYELYTGKTLPRLEFDAVRGDINAIKEATIDLDGTPLKVAVANGLKNAEELIRRVERGEADYIFIEIMACPGGCVNGGGQPLQPSVIRNFRSVSAMRAGALYQEDQEMPLRKSHKSPLIQEVYEHYLDQPGSQRAHQLLHTCYTDRSGQHR